MLARKCSETHLEEEDLLNLLNFIQGLQRNHLFNLFAIEGYEKYLTMLSISEGTSKSW
jgi:hypothetical protein